MIAESEWEKLVKIIYVVAALKSVNNIFVSFF